MCYYSAIENIGPFLLPNLSEKDEDLQNIVNMATTKALQQHFLQERADELNQTLETIFPRATHSGANRRTVYLNELVTDSVADRSPLIRRQHRVKCQVCVNERFPLLRRFKWVPPDLRKTISAIVCLTIMKYRQRKKKKKKDFADADADADDDVDEKDLAYKTATAIVHDWIDYTFEFGRRRLRMRKDFCEFRLSNPNLYTLYKGYAKNIVNPLDVYTPMPMEY